MSGDWAPHICAYCGKPGDLYGGWWNGREIYFCGDSHMREFHREKEAAESEDKARNAARAEERRRSQQSRQNVAYDESEENELQNDSMSNAEYENFQLGQRYRSEAANNKVQNKTDYATFKKRNKKHMFDPDLKWPFEGAGYSGNNLTEYSFSGYSYCVYKKNIYLTVNSIIQLSPWDCCEPEVRLYAIRFLEKFDLGGTSYNENFEFIAPNYYGVYTPCRVNTKIHNCCCTSDMTLESLHLSPGKYTLRLAVTEIHVSGERRIQSYVDFPEKLVIGKDGLPGDTTTVSPVPIQESASAAVSTPAATVNIEPEIIEQPVSKLDGKKSTSEHTLSMRGDDIVYTGSPSVFEIDSCLIISLDSSKTIKIHDIDIENKSDWNTADYCVKVWLSRKKTYANVKVDDLCLKTIEFNSLGPLTKHKIDIKEEISVPDTLPGGSYYVWLSLHEHDEAGKDAVSKEYRREIYYNVPLSEAEKEAERIAKEEAIAKEIAAEKAEWEKKQKEKAEAEKQAKIDQVKNSSVVDTPLSPEEIEKVNEIKKQIFDDYAIGNAFNALFPIASKRPKDNGTTVKELLRLLLLCSKDMTTFMGMPIPPSKRPVRNILKTYSIYYSDDKEGPITEIDLAILDKDLDSAAAILEKAKKDSPNENEIKAKEAELLCRQYTKNKDKNLLTKAEKILKSLPKTDDKFLNMYFAFVKDFYSAAIGDTHGLCTGKGYFYLREKDLFGLPADTGEKKISVPEPESKPEVIYCFKCGEKLPGDACFCFKCGTKLK